MHVTNLCIKIQIKMFKTRSELQDSMSRFRNEEEYKSLSSLDIVASFATQRFQGF